MSHILPCAGECEYSAPWFPRKISDLDRSSNRVLMVGEELETDHPGFQDEKYKARREYFANLAFSYKQWVVSLNIRTKIKTSTFIYTCSLYAVWVAGGKVWCYALYVFRTNVMTSISNKKLDKLTAVVWFPQGWAGGWILIIRLIDSD